MKIKTISARSSAQLLCLALAFTITAAQAQEAVLGIGSPRPTIAELPGDRSSQHRPGDASAASLDELVAANSVFAFNLMNDLTQAQPDANIFISPYSVSTVLQMTAIGAAGGTKAEMQQVLDTAGLSADSLYAASKALDQQLAGRTNVTLNIADGLWFQQGLHLKQAFVNDNVNFFQAEIANVDFLNPQSARLINHWADEQTRGKIPEVVQFPFPRSTRLILANAVYFKGTWALPFDPEATQPGDFYLPDGQSEQVPIMAQDGYFQYQENSDFQAIQLAYNGGLQMELFLPATNSSPQMLLAGLADSGIWRNVQAGFVGQKGTVMLPRFTLRDQILLNRPLEALGMTSAFGSRANFSGMASEPLSISQVQQTSFVDVDEEGTEAAAVTTVTMVDCVTSAPLPDEFTMILDRPFFFVISDVNTGSILFMGTVNDPAGGN
jgi:serine protease inhibitor